MNGNNYDDNEVTRKMAPPPVPTNEENIHAENFFVEGKETISKYYEKNDYKGLKNEVEFVIASYYEIYNNFTNGDFTNGDVFHDRDAFRENAINLSLIQISEPTRPY